MPMPSDFAVRLAGGLAVMLLITPWRTVPPAFYRTHGLIMVGLFALAALLMGRAPSPDRATVGLCIAGGALAYAASIGWGLGLRRIGAPATLGIVGVSLAVFFREAPGHGTLGLLSIADRIASSALLGASFTAMLLGHHHLTAPAMSIEPLKRFIRAIGASLLVRTVLACVALGLTNRAVSPNAAGQGNEIFHLMRWGMGLAGPALAAWLAWRTAAIRSTQSATGILYICVTLVLFGELTDMILNRTSAIPR